MLIPKVLIVFYSRARRTESVAFAIRNILEIRGLCCDVEPLREPTDRRGLLGYLRSGLEAALEMSGPILPLCHNPENYDLVIVGTPIWNGSISTPVRSFLRENADRLKDVAFFLTHGGSAADRAFFQMQDLASRPAVARLALHAHEVAGGDYKLALQPFADQVALSARRSIAAGAAQPRSPVSTMVH